MVPSKFRTRPHPETGVWFEVEPMVYTLASGTRSPRLRVTVQPGGYFWGDFRSVLELRARMRHTFGFDELLPVYEDDDQNERGDDAEGDLPRSGRSPRVCALGRAAAAVFG